MWVVRLGSKRSRGEGIRIGTVRLPPRGVPKAEFSSQNWYDVWFPTLAPSLETMKSAQKATTAESGLLSSESTGQKCRRLRIVMRLPCSLLSRIVPISR